MIDRTAHEDVLLLLSELASKRIKLAVNDERELSVRAPAGSLHDVLFARMRRLKPELISYLVESARPSASLPTIIPDLDNISVPFPLGDLQTAFLAGEQTGMEYPVRPHHYLERELPGVDPARFEVALNAALERQRANLPILVDDNRLAIIDNVPPVTVEVDDLRTLDSDEAEKALQLTRSLWSRRTLPLDRWPWFECKLSLYGADRVRLHWNNNNFFSDGYGTFRLLADVQRLYDDPEIALSELQLSYRDCVLAMSALEDTEFGHASQRYWLDRLPAMPSAPPVPRRSGNNPRERSRLQRRDAVIPEAQWSAFVRRCRRHRISATAALFTAYAEVLARWSGSRHFLLNNMVTHRLPMHSQISDILGNFASLYPLEVDLRGESSFADKARRLQSRMATDLDHSHWSGVKVLQALNQLQKTPGRAVCPFVVGSGLFMDPLDGPEFGCLETPQVVLDNQFWELKDGSFWAVWDVIEEAFPEGMIDAMWEAYVDLITRLSWNDDAWIDSGFELIPPTHRVAIAPPLRAPVDRPRLLHDRLAMRAARHPDRLAVVASDRSMSYQELHFRAQSLAQQLITAGVTPGQPVPVIIAKGWAQIVAVFGVLQAGAVYVPIDPDWPAIRIDQVLHDVDARLAVTFPLAGHELRLPAHVRSVAVEAECDDSRVPAVSVPRESTDLAYIIFTSGSTGTPKGVMISHGAALTTILDINSRFAVVEDDVVLGLSALHFDLSVYDIFGTIDAGATLVLPGPDDGLSPQSWLELVRIHGVTLWNSVPALMQLFVDAASVHRAYVPSLRLAMLSGDWIPVQLPARITQVAPNAEVVSLGGATEASIWSIFHRVGDVPDGATSIPYGRALGDQSWHVVLDDGSPAPEWVPGHLYIGGAGLATGYWNDEEKTNRAFVRHATSGERLYRTGDIGRLLPDGSIEFLGRHDDQVKINGNRVELGEIEHALESHPAVRLATAVVTIADGAGRVEAFVVTEDEAVVDPERLSAFLRARLPGHMVPSTIRFLSQLPLTANGKVDRRALSEGVEPVRRSHLPARLPRTPLEVSVATIWEEVLDMRPIFIDDDFFELGGQSFAAVLVMTRVSQLTGKSLAVSALLEGRTIASLVAQLETQAEWSPVVQLREVDGTVPVFLVHPAGGNILAYRHLSERLGRSVYGIQAVGSDGAAEPLADVREMAALYVRAMRKIHYDGPFALGGWSSGGVIALEMARQLEESGAKVDSLLIIDCPSPLDIRPLSDAALDQWFREDTENVGDFGEITNVFGVFSATIRATHEYRSIPNAISADITLVRATDGEVSEFADHALAHREDWGWREVTSGDVAVAFVAGTHHSILGPDTVDALIESITERGWRNAINDRSTSMTE